MTESKATELKTLKDMKKLKDFDAKFSDGVKIPINEEAFIWTLELRQEAIKWVKWNRKNQEPHIINHWIIRFFNLTGEDLKNTGKEGKDGKE